jgi:hypothetical protein
VLIHKFSKSQVLLAKKNHKKNSFMVCIFAKVLHRNDKKSYYWIVFAQTLSALLGPLSEWLCLTQ